jgi:CheY-like chemotaxis protein
MAQAGEERVARRLVCYASRGHFRSQRSVGVSPPRYRRVESVTRPEERWHRGVSPVVVRRTYPKGPAMETTARRTHVLLIDDTQDVLEVMRDLLEDEGYRVSVSMETLDLSRIKDLAPDLIVQDLLFAGTQETGWHALTLMRLDPELARVPLILCTGATHIVNDPAMAENLDRLGVRVLLKPFDLDDFLTTVAEALPARKFLDQVTDRQDRSTESGYYGAQTPQSSAWI